jgi:hypothetical protein
VKGDNAVANNNNFVELKLQAKKTLINSVNATDRPVAFLIGAPFSLHEGKGVSDVAGVIDIMRDYVGKKLPYEISDLNQYLSGKSGGEQYQMAMEWLAENIGQDAVNDVIKAGVLNARRSGAPEEFAGDGDEKDWIIPPGPLALGKLIVDHEVRFKGPIMTTNFDPLVSQAIRRAGGQLKRTVLTNDGAISRPSEEEGATIVHLHGFWRESDTLHTQSQLLNPRPQLKYSLQRLLRGRTLIVLAYSGWDDVFTTALRDIINDSEARIDVIWCFYENDIQQVKDRYKKLLTDMQTPIAMRRFRIVGGIDCHTILDELLASLEGTVQQQKSLSNKPAATVTPSPIPYWECIDALYLDQIRPLRETEVIRYFDGAVPNWRHTQCTDIPVRSEVQRVVTQLIDLEENHDQLSMQLIIAAGGEGKSTLLLQAASQIARRDNWVVLWRTENNVELPRSMLERFSPHKQWLLVIDDAESFLNDLHQSVKILSQKGVDNVHFLLATRDTDWNYVNGNRIPWQSYLRYFSNIHLRDLPRHDASLLVEAWEKYGEEGLRHLDQLADTDSRVEELLGAIQNRSTGEGSFFGGLLRVRFGSEGLKGHVVEMLARLQLKKITESKYTLFDAILFISACDAVGIEGLDERVLASLMDVPKEWIQSRVISPLGEEAAAVRSAGVVMTRHQNVAKAILVAADTIYHKDVAEIYGVLIKHVIWESKKKGTIVHHAKLMHIGPTLIKKLPTDFGDKKRKDIAIAAAIANTEGEPLRISRIVTLGKTYRIANDLKKASETFHESYPSLVNSVDYNTDIRGYYYEWGVVESQNSGNNLSGIAAGCWLQILSIIDWSHDVRLQKEQIMLGCTGAAIALERLNSLSPALHYKQGVLASIYFARLVDKGEKGRKIFLALKQKVDPHNEIHIADLSEAIEFFTAVVDKVKDAVSSEFMRKLNHHNRLSFSRLEELLLPSEGGRKVVLSRNEVAELLSYNSLQQKVDAGIARIFASITPHATQFTVAEQFENFAWKKVRGEVDKLSPKIKSAVKKHFNGVNWLSYWRDNR